MGIKIAEQGADPAPFYLGPDEGYAYPRSSRWYENGVPVDNKELWMGHVKSLQDLGNAAFELIQQTTECWAPELIKIGETFYIYYTDIDPATNMRAVYAIESQSKSPDGPHSEPTRLTPENEWAIDGTILELGDKLYLIASGWPEDTEPDSQQNLYIYNMESPMKVSGERVCISSPDLDWERNERPINEGPAILKLRDRVLMTFAASASWRPGYCTGLMELVGDDPTDPSCWKKREVPLMSWTDMGEEHDAENDEFGPGHGSFTTDDNGNTIFVYHTSITRHSGWDRRVRMGYLIEDDGGNLSIQNEPALAAS